MNSVRIKHLILLFQLLWCLGAVASPLPSDDKTIMARVDSIYASLSDEERAQVEAIPLREACERNHYYIRGAISSWKLYDRLLDVFGSELVDYYMKKGKVDIDHYVGAFYDVSRTEYLSYYTLSTAPEGSGAYFFYVWMRYLLVDHSKTTKTTKAFDFTQMRPIVELHTYPSEFSYLAAKDDSIEATYFTHFFKNEFNDHTANDNYGQYKWESAVQMADRILAEKQRTIGTHHPCYALTLSDLAMLYSDRHGDLGEAIQFQSEALDIYRASGCTEALQLAAKHLAYLYDLRSKNVWWAMEKNPVDSVCLQLMKWKEQELAIITPILDDETYEVTQAMDELKKYKKEHERFAWRGLWREIDSIYAMMPDSEQQRIRRQLTGFETCAKLEYNYNYIRAAIYERQYYNTLQDAFGQVLCDSLFGLYKNGWYFTNLRTDTTNIRYLAHTALEHIYKDKSHSLQRAEDALGKEKAKRYAGEYRKQFNVEEMQPVVDLHRYPQKHQYLAAKDDSLALLIAKDPVQALPVAEQLLAEKKRVLGTSHPCYALTLCDLAELCNQNAYRYNRGPARDSVFQRAIELEKQALAIYQKAQSPLATQLVAQFISNTYSYWNHDYYSLSFWNLSYPDIRSLIEQNQKQELAITLPILGEKAPEVIFCHAEQEVVRQGFASLHETGDDDRFRKAMELYHQGQYSEAASKFHYLSENEKFRNLEYRRLYSAQWEATCYLHLGDTAKAKSCHEYYMLDPIDRTKTLEIDYQLVFGNPDTCLIIARDLFEGNPSEYAHMLLYLSEVYTYYNIKAYAASATALFKAKDLCRELLGKDSPVYGSILYHLGVIYQATHYYMDAASTFEEVAAIAKHTTEKMGYSYYDIAQKLVKIGEELGDNDLKAHWLRELIEGDSTAKFKDRMDWMRDYLETMDPRQQDTVLLRQAVLYAHQLIDYYEQRTDSCSLQMFPSYYEDHPRARFDGDKLQDLLIDKRNIISIMTCLATCYRTLGQTEELEKLESEGIALLRDSISWNPGIPLKKDDDDLLSSYYYAITSIALCYRELGVFFTRTGNWELVIESMHRSKEIEMFLKHKYYTYSESTKQEPDLYDKDFYYTDMFTAVALGRLGRYEEAARLLQRTTNALAEEGWKTRHYLAKDYLLRYLSKTKGLYDIAPDLEDLWRYNANKTLRELAVLNSQERETYWNKNKNLFEETIPLDALQSGSPNTYGTLYDNALLCKGLLLNTEKQINDILSKSGDTTQQELYQQLQQNQMLLTTELQKPEKNRALDTDSLQALIRTQSFDLMKNMEKNSSNLIAQNLLDSWKNVQRCLKSEDVAIEFITIPFASDSVVYAALTLRKGYELPHLTILFTLEQLKALQPSDYYGTTALYDLIWKPLDEEFQNSKNVYFAPIGKLHQIAIEYLPGMEAYNTYRLSSTRELTNWKDKRTSQVDAVLFGGLQYELTDEERASLRTQRLAQTAQTFRDIPDMATLRSQRGAEIGIPFLEGSLLEVQYIDSLMENKHIPVYTAIGFAGTEEAFKSLSGKHKSIIHISTHGFYQPESQMTDNDNDLLGTSNSNQARQTKEDRSLSRSGLLMTGAGDFLFGDEPDFTTEDGILTAKEISQLDLSGLDLVVLSACETGLGDISGEGVFGLQRGFKKAGAQTLLVSLWKVEDDATQLLMTEFYNNLLDGDTKRDAFVKAQKTLRQAKGGRFNRYECWASFVMID